MRKIKTGIKMSDDFKKKVKDHHADVSGDKNPMWGTKRPEYVKEAVRKANSRGGITPINKLIRTSFAYLNWRKSVFERDNYTCQMCGNRGGKLNADHIKPFSIYLDLRFDLDNGRTLCVDCHKTTPTYGRSFYKTDLAYEK
jgi:5-methylcytosine-specific restriction endonuclease McrA